ncbi:MAG: exodeoxyribonuclease VII large subunit [Erysipelotrichaceae bacterium]|nr:exodeoxyribonuclease VII large subunit [Erysipelotrichaceae bacterium]
MSLKTVKVSTLVHYLKNKIDEDNLIQNLVVQGEISNFTNHRSGHWYFTLKDEKSRLNCVMFSSMVSKCKVSIKDGDKVFVRCSTSIFEASGQLQLFVNAIKLDGQGDLYLKFEEIKKKLYEEGLFDTKHKKEIPTYPFTIGLITGKNTAAREDVISTLKRRWPIAKVYELNTLVQGNTSSKEIINAIKKMDTFNLDVILLVRGGGSIEDLWSFNDENLAREIFAMKTPLISGVGHEVDVTIVDYVSDKRAPTPTGAAEMCTPNLKDVKNLIFNYENKMKFVINKDLLMYKTAFNKTQESYVFKNPIRLYEQKVMELDLAHKNLLNSINFIDNQKNKLNIIKNKVSSLAKISLNNNYNLIFNYELNLKNITNNVLEKNKQLFFEKINLLDAYSPLKVMERGYSIVFNKEKSVNSANDLSVGDKINIRFSRGNVNAQIYEVNDE